MSSGDAVREKNVERELVLARRRRQQKARQKALAAAEARQLEASRGVQERLRREFYTRNPHKQLAA